VFGVSGQLMLEALLEGKATIEEIANLARHTARRKIPGLCSRICGQKRNVMGPVVRQHNPQGFVAVFFHRSGSELS
jgi:hypothetical protein